MMITVWNSFPSFDFPITPINGYFDLLMAEGKPFEFRLQILHFEEEGRAQELCIERETFPSVKSQIEWG